MTFVPSMDEPGHLSLVFAGGIDHFDGFVLHRLINRGSFCPYVHSVMYLFVNISPNVQSRSRVHFLQNMSCIVQIWYVYTSDHEQ